MIFRNTVTNVLHWDFVSKPDEIYKFMLTLFQSVLGRIISLPVVDNQSVPTFYLPPKPQLTFS